MKVVIGLLKWIGLALLLAAGIYSSVVVFDDLFRWWGEIEEVGISFVIWVFAITYAALKKRSVQVAILSSAALIGSYLSEISYKFAHGLFPSGNEAAFNYPDLVLNLIWIFPMLIAVILLRLIARWKAEGNLQLANRVSGLVIAIPSLLLAAFVIYFLIQESNEDKETSQEFHISSQTSV